MTNLKLKPDLEYDVASYEISMSCVSNNSLELLPNIDQIVQN